MIISRLICRRQSDEKMKLRLLKYLPFLLCLYSTVYSQEGTLNIDNNFSFLFELAETKIIRVDDILSSKLDIRGETWEFIRFGADSQQSEPQVERHIEEQVERRIQQQYMRIFLMTVLFAAALFNLVLFFGFNKNISYLFFSIYCLANSRMANFFPFRILEDYVEALTFGKINIDMFMWRLSIFSLLAYLITRFRFHKTQKIYSAFVLILPLYIVFFPITKLVENLIFFLIPILSFSVVILALYKKKEGSVFIFTGVSGLFILFYLALKGILLNGEFFGMLFFIVCISILSSREIASQVRKHREAVLRSARLENELLKRNIQPHFILNTLASLQELVEQSPKKASRLIQELAEEFQMFSKVSGEKLICISDELKICNTHLKIMEFRKGMKFALSVEGIEGTEKIPPGIFHTLIENGTTHGYTRKKSGRFSIRKERRAKCIRYIVFNDSEYEDSQEEMRKGTGMKYIEARLEESFPGSWKLSSQRVNDGWEVVVDIFDNKEHTK